MLNQLPHTLQVASGKLDAMKSFLSQSAFSKLVKACSVKVPKEDVLNTASVYWHDFVNVTPYQYENTGVHPSMVLEDAFEAHLMTHSEHSTQKRSKIDVLREEKWSALREKIKVTCQHHH